MNIVTLYPTVHAQTTYFNGSYNATVLLPQKINYLDQYHMISGEESLFAQSPQVAKTLFCVLANIIPPR